MRIPVLSRRRSVPLSAAVAIGAAAALVFGPVNPIGAIRDGGEACSSVTPNFRALDTRKGPGTKLGNDTTIDVKVADVTGVPASAKTVKLQITATDLTGSGGTFMVAYPKGTQRPPSSNINPVRAHDSSNGAVPVEVGSDESITIYNERGSIHVIVDILEWCDDHNHDTDYGVGHVAYKVGQTETSTTSASFGDIADAEVSVQTKADGHLLITFSTQTKCKDNDEDNNCSVRVLVDGTAAMPAGGDAVIFDKGRDFNVDALYQSHSHQWVYEDLSAGSHTVQVQYKNSDGTDGEFFVDEWTLSVMPLLPLPTP